MPDLFPSPDPIQSPKDYQDYLLKLLGEDDPAVLQSQTPSTLRTLVDQAAPDLWRRPEPSEWSVGECIAHVFDAELVMSSRYRFVLAHDEPPLIGYDQDLWVDRLHGDTDDMDAMLDLFETLRRANVALWNDTPDDMKQRVGMHAERGPESYELAFLMLAGHDRFHIAQARRALEAF
jgi:DinB superfamily